MLVDTPRKAGKATSALEDSRRLSGFAPLTSERNSRTARGIDQAATVAYLSLIRRPSLWAIAA